MSTNVMIVFTLVMIIWLIVSNFIRAIAIEIIKQEANGKNKEELALSIILSGCIGVPILFGYTITKLVYYLYFLEYDILKYPTYLMLFLFACGVIKFFYRIVKKMITKHEDKSVTKVTVGNILMIILGLAFYTYALTILILG